MEKTKRRSRRLRRFLLLLLPVAAVLILVVGFPRRPPLRTLVPPLTFFDAFFGRYAFLVHHALEGQETGEGENPLYRAFCADPAEGGRRLERILDAATDRNAYCAPLLRVFTEGEPSADEKEEVPPDRALRQARAVALLQAPAALPWRGGKVEQIRRASAANWKRFPSRLRERLAALFSAAAPAAAAFRAQRRALGLGEGGLSSPPSPGPGREKAGFAAKLSSLAAWAATMPATSRDSAALETALAAYCEEVDAFIREAPGRIHPGRLSALPGGEGFPSGVLYAADTPFGLVIVSGPGNDVYPAKDVFLLVDLGGDDTYFFDTYFCPPERGGREASCSTVIDLDGDDLYVGGTGEVAAGFLGYRTVVDLRGDDRYRSGAFGLGAGFLGLGLLVDGGGDDQYMGGLFSLGAGAYGAGFLLDESGDDVYRGGGLCQGFAASRGSGCLVDGGGFDLYYCSVEGPGRKQEGFGYAGFSQGCAVDFDHGRDGGVALLLDLAGDDCYQCPSWGQGAARGRGVGILVDGGGFDFYSGRERCQGAARQGGIGILRDLDGGDHYLALGASQGTAGPGSVGILVDDGGDDRYIALDRLQGYGPPGGAGILYDREGEDRYFSREGKK